MPTSIAPLHLVLEVDGFGHHPAAWRLAPDPGAVFTGRHQRQVARTAERGGLDALTLADRFGPRPAGPAELRGGLEALTLAAALGPVTEHIGLVPTVTVTHTEPFHVAKNLATLDHVTRGRSGWVVSVSDTETEARLVGRRPVAPRHELYAEAAEVADVVGRLCDSWEDDAIIRDVATGRYIDRERLHYVDFEGTSFSVRGPSITPRPPQGRPVVAVEVVDEPSAALAAAWADLAFVAPGAEGLLRTALAASGRDRAEVRVLADLTVLLGHDDADASQRLATLEALGSAPRPDHVGGPGGLVERLSDLPGDADGVRLRPFELLGDLDLLVERVVPELRRRGRRPEGYAGSTLRQHLGLARPANRYAGQAS